MKKKKWLSIFLVVCLIGGIGGGIWYRQKRIDERQAFACVYSKGRRQDK